ncbi:MAG TPA: arginase [Patescibacteria group bacterium]|nr:arginase [Patescibacteria group bacterium]
MTVSQNVSISLIGVPLDLGAGRRGVDMGPSAIRYANITERLINLGHQVHDVGDIAVQRDTPRHSPDTRLHYLDEIERVNYELCQTVAEQIELNRFPLVLGGDHSIAIGTFAGLLRHKKRPGVIWFDAHSDINTPESTPSGNIHGMPVAVAMGLGEQRLTTICNGARLRPEHFVQIGVRDLDPGEKKLLRELGITVFTMHEVDLLGMRQVMEEAIRIAGNGTDHVHVSFDMDAVDPLYAPGVGTPVVGGLTYRESHLAMEMLSSSGIVGSAEFVEVNTVLDHSNQTGKMAVALIGSLMGERLL